MKDFSPLWSLSADSGPKITSEKQTRLGCCVNIAPVCFSDWVTWLQTDRQTDEGEERGRSSCSARMTQSVCCLSAYSRSPKDSVTLTSSNRSTSYLLQLYLYFQCARVLPSYLSVYFHFILYICFYLSDQPAGDSSLLVFTQHVATHDEPRQLLYETLNTLQTKYHRVTYGASLSLYYQHFFSKIQHARVNKRRISFVFVFLRHNNWITITTNPAWGNKSGRRPAALLHLFPKYDKYWVATSSFSVLFMLLETHFTI